MFKSRRSPACKTMGYSGEIKCLIVDDHGPMRRMIRRILAKIRPVIVECSDGQSAVTLFSQHQPDWVFMDLEMEVMNGLAATQLIKNQFPGARIVIVTQHDDDALRQSARRAGAHAYVLKENLLEILAIVEAGAGK